MGYDLKYKYLTDSNAYQVVGYIGKPIDVTINEFHDGKRITSIGQDVLPIAQAWKQFKFLKVLKSFV